MGTWRGKTMKDLSVVVPCYNEEENIPLLVERIIGTFRYRNIDGELILVDDCSKDHTWSLIKKYQKKYSNVHGVHNDVNLRMVRSWKKGVSYAKGKYVVIIDADLQYLPEDIPRLYECAKSGNYDLVQGWRIYAEGTPTSRIFFSKAMSVMLNILFWTGLKDVKSGFILYKRSAFNDIFSDSSEFIYFQHLMTVAALAKGYTVKQIPVIFEKRHAGVSYISNLPWKFMWDAARDIPKALKKYLFRRKK
jgi:phenylacetate-CoA ligase